MIKKIMLPSALGVAGGILLSVAFAPFDLWILGWFALVPLVVAIKLSRSAAIAALAGFLFGFANKLTSIHWVLNVISGYSSLPAYLQWITFLMLAAFLALYPMLYALGTRKLLTKWGTKALLFSPLIWVGLEYLQTYILTGFPWNLVGYSQVYFLPAVQIADITGVYGVSFIIVLFGACMVYLFFRWQEEKKLVPDQWLSIALALVLLTFVYGFVRLAIEQKDSDSFQVALIQDHHDNDSRLQVSSIELFNYYVDETREAARSGADVVLWGEGSMVFLEMFGENGEPPTGFTEQYVLSVPRDEDTWLLMGSNDISGDVLFNTALTISPENENAPSGRYAKNHLTPFGEYVPYMEFFFWLDKIVPEIFDFGSGAELNTMPLLDGRVGVPICLEMVFPDLVRRFSYNGATVLATVSNDAWFGRSAANDQHFNHGVLRAVENRRYLLRCAVSGVSGIIHPSGRILQRSETYVDATITGEAAMRDDMTFYAAFGDVFAVLCIVLSVLAFSYGLILKAKKDQ